MFERPSETYELRESIIHVVLGDESNPTKRVACLIPNGATVLDIGAGNGMLPTISQRLNKTITFDGIEPDPRGAQVARPLYRRFHQGYLEDCAFHSAEYQFIVCGDVIEHTVNPEQFLMTLKGWLRPSTKLLLSLPNVAFAAVRCGLLDGHFDYVDSGLLERTHLRFFTYETIESMVNKLSLNIDRLYLLQRDPLDCEIHLNETSVKIIRRLARDELALTYQFLLELGQQKGPTEKIVIPPRTRGWERLPTLKRRTRATYVYQVLAKHLT